jgi:hypothetical protein
MDAISRYSQSLLVVLFVGCGSTNAIEGDAAHDIVLVWDAPVDEGLSDIPWRESEVPWCAGTENDVWVFDIWSSETAIYTLIQYVIPGSSNEVQYEVLVNYGSGWSTYHSEIADGSTSCLESLTGDDSDVLYTWGGASASCALGRISEGGSITREGFGVWDIFTAANNRIFAIMGGATEQKIIEWVEDEWVPVPFAVPPYEVQHLWSDGIRIWAVGNNGTVVDYNEGTWTVHDIGTLDVFSSIAGIEDGRIFTGTNSGRLFMYSESDWEELSWPSGASCGGASTIHSMWSTGNDLYFATAKQLTLFSSESFSVLGAWECDGEDGTLDISSLWGNSAEEVFIGVSDPNAFREYCGDMYILWYDGSMYHWL